MNILIDVLLSLYRFDTPKPFGVYFQESATPLMEVITELHDYIMYFMFGILGIVG